MILCLDMLCTTSRSILSREKPWDRGRFNDIMFRYVVYYIKDEKTIQVESLGERDASYNDFLRDLQKAGEAECRYLNNDTKMILTWFGKCKGGVINAN